MNEMSVTTVSLAVGDSSSGVQQVADYYAERTVTPRKGEPVQQSKPEPVKAPQSDVVLRFNVDRETNEVTVYIMDRASRQIIRTIPPDELNNLKAGDLLELLA